MSTHQIFGVAAGFIALAAFIPYIIGTMWGTVKPERATWLVLATNSLVLHFSYTDAGQADAGWYTLAVAVGPSVVFVLSLWRGVGGLSRFNASCLAGALTAAIIWWSTDSPMLAVWMGIAVDSFGILPTVRKVLCEEKDGESLTAWTLSSLASVIALLGMSDWSLANSAYPTYLLVGNVVVLGTIVVARRR